MRPILTAMIAAPLLIASPALAAGQGRVELRGGYDSIDLGDEDDDLNDFGTVKGVLYGIAAGYDFDLGSKAFIGIEGSVEDSSGDFLILDAERDLGAAIRLGLKVGEHGRAYVGAGYSNFRVSAGNLASGNADGIRGLAGFEFGLNDRFYGKVEYRYTNYEAGVSRHQGLAGLGLRF